MIGDHSPNHIHVFRDGKELAKITIPDLLTLSGKSDSKMLKTIRELMEEGELEI